MGVLKVVGIIVGIVLGILIVYLLFSSGGGGGYSDGDGGDPSDVPSLYSDLFYKQDISIIKRGESLDKIMRLKPKTYRFK